MTDTTTAMSMTVTRRYDDVNESHAAPSKRGCLGYKVEAPRASKRNNGRMPMEELPRTNENDKHGQRCSLATLGYRKILILIMTDAFSFSSLPAFKERVMTYIYGLGFFSRAIAERP